MQKEAFLQLALREERTLYRVARTILRSDEDCADAVQEALCRAVEKAFLIRREEYAKTWLIRVLINSCRDIQRKNARHEQVNLSGKMMDVLPSPSREEEWELKMILGDMDEKLRLPLILHHLEGYSVREISSILKIPEGTVKRRLWNARKELREALMKEAL